MARRDAAADEGTGGSLPFAMAADRLLASARADLGRIEVSWHPLGFAHFELTKLTELNDGERLRLHVWLTASDSLDGLGLVHDHRWLLSSRVLCGALVDTQYTAEYARDGRLQEVAVHYGRQIERVATGRYADLTPKSVQSIEGGGSYSVPAGVPHSTKLSAYPTATLVHTGPPIADVARVFTGRSAIAGRLSRRPSIVSNEGRRILDLVLGAIG